MVQDYFRKCAPQILYRRKRDIKLKINIYLKHQNIGINEYDWTKWTKTQLTSVASTNSYNFSLIRNNVKSFSVLFITSTV